MTGVRIDDALADWGNLAKENWQSLLLGNGFSINVWSGFNYDSLLQVARQDDLEHQLNEESVTLFDHVGSSNFEDVLRILFHARMVDEQLGRPQGDEIEAIYQNTKRALADAVNYSHVAYGQFNAAAINEQLGGYDDVFTTNYDLIPYWSIMHEGVDRFRDFFWGADGVFELCNTEVFPRRTKIHYLHGAIHLVELPDGRTKKLATNQNGNLLELFDLNARDQFPLFISEGHWQQKLSRICKNDYLRFCFSNLSGLEGNAVIIGHSLHRDYDQHIIDAISQSSVDRLAIGVWPHQRAEVILDFKARIIEQLHQKSLDFFDSESHPLGSEVLRVEK
ncbi:conserved hypothetical protein [Nitrosococcus oceani ATCC 19707]|uniref:SIR2-like domain-containing protein n=2 Tax=Nitrosococcus oceani TaxID=1229 RepID=Q3JE14_NITOC|nr:DUF4917 family protein [Nitrosococcus oceani]ABA56932.1 conserved hypothetical protein [Nitrosococcus oceani ATCC 19707]EDZ66553.1 hypothetical protein NOC27_3233 [Nitrosococcus oceani AFC27]KFI20621.1 hypothetical protein IB75_02075 [Nitrosococcus oceani C-27]GEM20845.1 DUF4917 domain-containing protein [Nitrosococcus oceani]